MIVERKEQLLKTLQENRTLVRMKHAEKDLENLTLITDMRTRDNTAFLVVDCPREFRETLQRDRGKDLKLIFEFTGKDNIKYSFTTHGGEIAHDAIYLKFPEAIERHQRRRHFRIDVPAGTRLHTADNEAPLDFNVVNVSLGGVLSTHAGRERLPGPDASLEIGSSFRDIELAIPFEDGIQSVFVRMIVLVRFDEKPDRARISYGMHFLDIDQPQKKILNDLIYRLQRDMLRRRVHLQ